MTHDHDSDARLDMLRKTIDRNRDRLEQHAYDEEESKESKSKQPANN